MVMHFKQPMHRGQLLKSQAQLISPDPNYAPPPMPQLMPAYMTVNQPVRPAAISQARHALLSRKVLKNISTSTPFGVIDKFSMLRTPRRPKLSDKLSSEAETHLDSDSEMSDGRGAGRGAGAYDQWLPRRTGRVRRICDDIPSTAVTNMVAQGLLIDADWLERGDPDWHPDWHDEDAEGETDLGEDVSFEHQRAQLSADDALPVLDVGMWDAAHPQPEEQEGGPSGTRHEDAEMA